MKIYYDTVFQSYCCVKNKYLYYYKSEWYKSVYTDKIITNNPSFILLSEAEKENFLLKTL